MNKYFQDGNNIRIEPNGDCIAMVGSTQTPKRTAQENIDMILEALELLSAQQVQNGDGRVRSGRNDNQFS